MHGEAFAHDSVIAYDKLKKHEKKMDIFYSEFVVSDNTRIYPQVSFFAVLSIDTSKYVILVQKGQPGIEMDGPLLCEERKITGLQWNEYFFNIENGNLFQSPAEIKDGQAKKLVGLLAGCTVSECDAGSNGRLCLLFVLIRLQSNMASR